MDRSWRIGRSSARGIAPSSNHDRISRAIQRQRTRRGINPQFFILATRYLFPPSRIAQSMLLSCGAAALWFLLLAAYLRPMMNHRGQQRRCCPHEGKKEKKLRRRKMAGKRRERIAVTPCTRVRAPVCAPCVRVHAAHAREMVELQREIEEDGRKRRRRERERERERPREGREREKARGRKGSDGRGEAQAWC